LTQGSKAHATPLGRIRTTDEALELTDFSGSGRPSSRRRHRVRHV